jgi:uncharacterized protein YukE
VVSASGEGFEVKAAELRASAAVHAGQAGSAAKVASTVQAATAQGNLFGTIGQMAGLDRSYQSWVDGEVNALQELSRFLNDLGDGLRVTADTYEAIDQAAHEGLRGAYGGQP